MAIRTPDFAGSWYPGTKDECVSVIEEYKSSLVTPKGKGIVGGIVPHAGWYFSGQIAFNVIHSLKQEQEPDTVVVFGMHLSAGSKNHIMKQGEWENTFRLL